ncbi:MAG: hypothetical protein GY856_12255 [bacterium]|nr:hypothetical protein [bacterium]
MLKRQILVRPDGRNVFDGVIDLDHHAKGQLVARRPSGDQLLTTGHTTLGLETPDAVDVGWLRWQRDDHSFRMRTSGDDRSFAPDELIQGGRLLMEEVVAVLARDERIYAANRHGVWIFEGGSPALDQPNVDYHEISLPGKIIAAHGRFLTLTPQRSLVVEDEDFERDSYPTHEATIGVYVRFNELVRGRRILGEITSTSGGTLDAFGDNGPRWDQRRGIAFAGDGLILLSDAGIHPLDLERAAFDPGPGNRALSGGRLRRGRDGELYFNDGTKWYRRQAGAWVPAAASDLQAGARVASRLWTWRWRDGRIEVSRRGDRQRFALHQGTDELYCTSDRLRAATVHDQDLFVLTDAFLEVAADPEQLAAGEARRLPPIRGRRLRSLRLRPRAPPELYLERDGEILRWSPDAESFVALASAAQNPYRQRWLAETKRLRFRTIGTQVVKELRLDLPEGGDAWKSFRFSTNGFPCDQVTALGALDERLFVHTRAGLQVFGRGGATGLASLDAFFHLGEKSANAVTDLPVRLGRPLAAADRFLIRSGERCWEWLDDRLGPCRSPASLGERLRGSNPLWQWSEYGGELRGVYQSRGHITSTPARLVEGRWPHDRLRSLAACRGRAASVWENRWISRHGGGELSLSTGEHDNRLAANDPDRLLCLHRPLPLRRGEVPAGLYAVLKTEIRRRAFDSWQLVAGAEAEALRKHLEDPPVLRYGDLRLRDSYRFEQRDRRGDWHPLEWRDRRVGIDRIDDLIVIGDVLWAVTPEGFVSFERARDGTLRLDPDNLTVVREPADAERLCTVTDLDFARDLDLASDDGVVVRCGYDSQRVFSGRLERAADTGIFEPCPGGDPFASRVLIKNEETGYWEWRLEGRRGGHPGTLSATLHKEPIALAGGRFDFDALSSMATFQPGRIELVGDGGWYQTPLDRLHVREFRRPPIELPIAPAAVTRVGVTRAENDERLLCLVGEPGSAFLLSAEEEDRGQIANCAEDLGRDTLWRYAGLHGELHIEAPGIAGGTARRAMRDGRFSDHRVTGLPATGVDDGEVFYLLPTEAAVIRLDEDAIPEALDAPPFAGMSPSTVPAVIYIDAQDGLVYVTSDGFYRARDGRKLAAMDDQVPEGSVMVALEDGPGDLLRIRWHRDGVAGWSLLRRKDYALDSYNRLPFNVGSWRSFKRRSTRWGQVDETLDLHLVAGGLDLRPRPPSGYVRRVWAYPLQPLTVVLSGQIALAVERDEVWEADLDRPMIELYNDIQDRP